MVVGDGGKGAPGGSNGITSGREGVVDDWGGKRLPEVSGEDGGSASASLSLPEAVRPASAYAVWKS